MREEKGGNKTGEGVSRVLRGCNRAKGSRRIQKQGKNMGMVLEGFDRIDLARRKQAEGRVNDLKGGFD